MIRNKYAAFVLHIIVVLAFWNLLEYLYVTFITRSTYQFTVGSSVVMPVVLAVVLGFTVHGLRDREGI